MPATAAAAPKTLADVTLSFHTLGEAEPHARAAAASAAGFRKIALSARRTRTWLVDHSLPELRELLARTGLVVSELEALTPMRDGGDENTDFALTLAHALDVPLIQVVGPYDGSVDDAVGRLRALADRDEAQGITLSLEFLPFTNISTLALGTDIVRRVERDNLGLCLDSWHLYRSGGSPADLDDMWPHLVSIQMNDGPLVAEEPDLFTDCTHNRRLPGQGEFDVVGILAEAQRRQPGYALSIEVISDELKPLPLAEVARRNADAVTTTLSAVQEALHV